MTDRDGSEGGEGFLSRWSRRKEAARKAGAPSCDPAPPSPPAPPAEPEPELEPEPEIDPASLPRIEDLTAESDLSAFLRRGVPAALRNAALRRAWSLDPAIRDHVGPADYAWDWNVPGGAPGYAADVASGADVEALADRLLGLARGQPEEEGAAGGGAAPALPSEPERAGRGEAVPEKEAGEPAAVRLTTPGAAGQGGDRPREREPARVEERAARPAGRRHGGAVPAWPDRNITVTY